MTTCVEALDFESVVARGTREELISEGRRSLTIPVRAFSKRVTTLPQYYPTCTERDILACNADAIVAAVLAGTSQPLRILELAAGVASKTPCTSSQFGNSSPTKVF
jgi:hypothetical protein